MSDLGDVHLLYNVLWALPVCYTLYTNSLSALFGIDFMEPYKSIQEMYKNAFHCRLFAMA